MKIEMHGYYDHFPNHRHDIPFEPYIDCFNDCFVASEYIPKNSIALMIEPRSIDPVGYDFLLRDNNWKKFKYIFTHDSELLRLPNAHLILWGFGNANYNSFNDVPKTKNISMVSSDKELCELHKIRKQLALDLKGHPLVDTMGTFDGGAFVDTKTIYAPYKFSIVVENYIDDYWFTEKICNCFANKTIPLYLGSPKIYKFFNPQGIMSFQPQGLKDWLEYQTPEILENKYNRRLEAIEDNYNRVKQYENFETWFFNKYGELLDEIS